MRITMQYKMFLIKYAEIGTKGKNRYVFEEIMCKRMRARLKPLGKFEVRREYGRIFVEAFSDYDYEDVMKVLTTIFGIVGVCPVKVVEELSYEAISKAVAVVLAGQTGFPAYHLDRAFVTGICAGAASITFLFIYSNDFSNHCLTSLI